MFGLYTCTYCGAPADSRDHVIPKSYSGIGSKSHKHTVPCCQHCNKILGNIALHTVHERAWYIGKRLFEKSEKIKIGERDELELKDLSERLREYVVVAAKEKKEMLKRIEWADLVHATETTIKDVWVAIQGWY